MRGSGRGQANASEPAVPVQPPTCDTVVPGTGVRWGWGGIGKPIWRLRGGLLSDSPDLPCIGCVSQGAA